MPERSAVGWSWNPAFFGFKNCTNILWGLYVAIYECRIKLILGEELTPAVRNLTWHCGRGFKTDFILLRHVRSSIRSEWSVQTRRYYFVTGSEALKIWSVEYVESLTRAASLACAPGCQAACDEQCNDPIIRQLPPDGHSYEHFYLFFVIDLRTIESYSCQYHPLSPGNGYQYIRTHWFKPCSLHLILAGWIQSMFSGCFSWCHLLMPSRKSWRWNMRWAST